MIVNRILAASFIGFFLFVFSCPSVAGLGDGTSTNPNPTGSFGQTSTDPSTSPNPTGSLGSGADMPLADPPPPPPDPVPLDGGVSLLIAAALGLGAKKLYSDIKNK